jgi:CDP-glycerol glycerophosphotransferase (TagB/SpsB family)/glycosyltransferase involved in cell wall biosynthesis
VKKVLKRKLNRKYEFQYLRFLKKPIEKNTILIESTHGRDFSGHVFYMTKELQNRFPEMKIIVGIKSEKKENFEKLFQKHELSSVKVVEYLSKEYMFSLATSEYLINDTTFWDFFNKRPEQTYINIWHGTPLKCLGKDMALDGFGNVQKNFLSSDLFVLSNDYTKEKMVNGYNLKNISSTKVIVGPSPRNSILFNDEKREEIRNSLNISEKKVYLYMPTYRDTGTSTAIIEETLSYLDEHLPQNALLFVKLHPFDVEKLTVDLSEFKSIVEYPDEVETYEFLTAIDTLITDYSSIMYDFSCTDRQVILYTYDKEDYYKSRGLYEDIDDYPFIQVVTKEALCREMIHPTIQNFKDLAKFKEKFVAVDNIDGTKQLLDYIFRNVKTENITEHELRNKKENIVFFAGGLWDNGISRAFFNTLNSIDLSEKNYILYVKDRAVKKEHKYKLQELGIPYVLSAGIAQYNFIEGILTYLYLNKEWFGRGIGKNLIEKIIFKMYRRDFRRMFNGLEINQFIHYTGFERSLAAMLSALSESKIKTSIFYHTDMFEEYEAKRNISMKTLKRTYELADQLIIVNKELKSRLLENYPNLNNIIVLDNFLGYQDIRTQSKESIFTSLLNVPLQYGYAENLMGGIMGEFNELKKTNIKVANKFLPTIRKHKLSTQGLFPHVEKHFGELNRGINKPFEEFIDESSEVKINYNELGYLYGVSKLRLMDDLLNPDIKVFINIGRFDIQKGHDRLIDSFVEINKDYPNTRLIIVAPHGPLKNQTIKKVRNSGIKECITILGGMDNPYSLLRLSDAFVFTSLYEGLGLVVFEALAVGTDVITVDIPATTEGIIRGSSEKYPAAMIVEDSLEGIIDGWKNYMSHTPILPSYDFDTQEAESLKVWHKIVN